MNPAVLILVLVSLAGLLVLLSCWQRRIEAAQKELISADLEAASRHGGNRAIAQYPQIDPIACIGCGTCIAACPEEGVIGLVDGVAFVIHASRCIGHGLCEDACPVGAIEVGLGDISGRADIPVLDERFQSTREGIYLAGELGGLALIRIAVEQGIRVIRHIAADLGASRESVAGGGVADVLVVGAGPAGFAASLEAIARGLSYVTIDQDDLGGTVRKYPRRKLTLTGPLTLPLYGPVKKREFLKEELIQFWEEVAERYGVAIRSGVKFLGVTRRDDGVFEAHTSEGVVEARRIVLALGRRGTPRKIGVPGEELEKVLYQLVDAATYENEHILIVGGGDSAIEAATALASQRGNVVTISYRRSEFFRLKKRNADRILDFRELGKVRVIFDSDVVAIDERSVVLRAREDGVERRITLPNSAVFVFAGGDPPYPLLRELGVRFNADPEPQLEAPVEVVA